MYKSEPRANLILINHANKVYELGWGQLRPIEQYWLPKNPILKLI